MPNFVNLLDIVYPVGSMYFSASSVSPVDTVGGTWMQIKDAVLAASGDSYSAAGNFSGNKAITIEQMPSHNHYAPMWLYTDAGRWSNGADNVPATCYQVSNKQTCVKIVNKAYMANTGGGQDYIPYHYSINIWKRIA